MLLLIQIKQHECETERRVGRKVKRNWMRRNTRIEEARQRGMDREGKVGKSERFCLLNFTSVSHHLILLFSVAKVSNIWEPTHQKY